MMGGRVHVTARMEYGLRAVIALAEAWPGIVTAGRLAADERLPRPYLYSILADLRRAGLVRSRRGRRDGGYHLGRDPENVTIGQVVRVLAVPSPVTATFEAIDLVSIADMVALQRIAPRTTSSTRSRVSAKRGSCRG
jgi:Rrf2 family protein